MTVLRQKWIKREDLRANPEVYYLFGDNTERWGTGGQAKEMRGEPNAIGIATKITPTQGSNAYFSDDDFLENCRIIATDLRDAFQKRDMGHIIVIPLDGLGTGLSKLPQKAPRTNRFLLAMLRTLTNGGRPAWKQILNG